MGTRRGNLESWISEVPNKDGYYEAFVSMGTKASGKPDRRHVKRRDLAAVRRRVRELERDRDAGLVTRPGKVPTVTEMLTRHLTVVLPQRRRAPRTIDDYWSKCRNHIFPLWGGQRADRLLPEHIEDGLAEMLAEGLAPSHVRKVLAILSSAYQVQVKRGNLKRNPCAHVEAPELAEPEMVSLTQDEAQRVVDATREREDAGRWLVAMAHGLRQGEALGMRWDYLDLDTGKLDIWHQLQRLTWRHGCADTRVKAMRKAGALQEDMDRARQDTEHACARRYCKTRPCPKRCSRHTRACPPPCAPDCTSHARDCPQRRDGGLVLREIKEKRRKTLWLDPAFCALLRKHRDDQSIQRLEADIEWEDHGMVFCQWNGRPIDPRRDWASWCQILGSSGLPPQRLHAMRHSAATIMIALGVVLPVVKEMLGHSDIRVTQRYVHVAEAQMRDASARMAQAFLGSPDSKKPPVTGNR